MNSCSACECMCICVIVSRTPTCGPFGFNYETINNLFLLNAIFYCYLQKFVCCLLLLYHKCLRQALPLSLSATDCLSLSLSWSLSHCCYTVASLYSLSCLPSRPLPRPRSLALPLCPARRKRMFDKFFVSFFIFIFILRHCLDNC